MIASSAKGLSNLLEGTYLNLGNYDQCLSIVSSKISTSNISKEARNQSTVFYGKYCLLEIIPQSSLRTSIELNDSIKQSDLLDLTLNVSQKIDLLFRFPNEIQSKIGFCLPSFCVDTDVTTLINSGKFLIFDFNVIFISNFDKFLTCNLCLFSS